MAYKKIIRESIFVVVVVVVDHKHAGTQGMSMAYKTINKEPIFVLGYLFFLYFVFLSEVTATPPPSIFKNKSKIKGVSSFSSGNVLS